MSPIPFCNPYLSVGDRSGEVFEVALPLETPEPDLVPAILEKLYVLDLRVGELARPLQIADNLALRDDVLLQDLKNEG